MKGAKEDDERKKEKMQEAVEEQRHREKEEWLKRKMNETQSGTAPTPVKKPKSTHGAAIRSGSSKVGVLCKE